MRVLPLLLPILALAIGCRPQSETGQRIEPVESADSEAFSFDPWVERLGVHSAAEIASVEHDRESIDLSGTDVADDDLRHLRNFDRLESLNLSSTNLTDAAAEHILKLGSLRELDLVFTQTTGAGIRKLSAHPSLTKIQVWYDQLDDDGLAGLQNMQKLKQVYLWVPDLGDEDDLLLPKIKKIRPDVDVEVMWYVDPQHELSSP